MTADLERDPFVPGAEVARKFTLRKRLGVGGAGEVWSATNGATGGLVALKLVRKTAVSRDTAARFKHEASLSASLSHRNIVRVFDYFEETDGTLGLVMEYLRGENARERLLRTGILPTRHAVSIATQVLSALAHAHDCKIVHRDIKPPNVFLATEPDGSVTPKLLDFGIAKTTSSSVVTLDGQLLGTPRYMSPEQIRADREIDGRSDLFSVAVMLYELLTGRCPFAAGFATASLAAVLEAKVERDAHIPEPLWLVLEKALAKAPEARIQTATALADALRDAVDASDAALSSVLRRSIPSPAPLVDSAHGLVVALPRPPPMPSDAKPESQPPATPASARRRKARRVVTIAIGACTAILALGVLRSAIRVPPPERAPSETRAAAAPAAPPPRAEMPPLAAPPAMSAAPVATTPAAATAIAPVTPPSPARVAPTAARPSPAPRASASSSRAIVRDPGF